MGGPTGDAVAADISHRMQKLQLVMSIATLTCICNTDDLHNTAVA